MGGASPYSNQFLSHSGPRGPPGMNHGGMVPLRPGLPPSTGGLYPSHPAQAQRMPQHTGFSGGQQGLKRPFHSEVSGGFNFTFDIFYFFFQSSLTFRTLTAAEPMPFFNCCLFSQGFPGQQYNSGGISGYSNQPLQYPSGPQQRCAPSPSYPSSRMPHMGPYTSGTHNPTQFPPGASQPNPPQFYKVIRFTVVD